MAFAKEELEQLKGWLSELKQEIAADIERKLTTATTNIERTIKHEGFMEDSTTVVKLRREIQTNEDNLKQELQKVEERLVKKLKP